MSSSGWFASPAQPHPSVLHVKRDCVTDLNWTDKEYALCISFKAKGTLLTSLWEGRRYTQAMMRWKLKASGFTWNFEGHSRKMAHQATFCLSYLIAFTSVPMETAASWRLLRGMFYHLFSRGLVPSLQFEWILCSTAKLTGPRRTSITNLEKRHEKSHLEKGIIFQTQRMEMCKFLSRESKYANSVCTSTKEQTHKHHWLAGGWGLSLAVNFQPIQT